MTEEKVTINLLKWLQYNGWKIICFDFPQSGTGILLHPNHKENSFSKNCGGIIPDIIATRNSIALYFENKDRFYLRDFQKIRDIKVLNNYSESINSLLFDYNISQIFYGIGIPANTKHISRSLENIEYIDFLISTDESGEVFINYDKFGVLK